MTVTDLIPNQVCFHGNHWNKRHIDRNNIVHDSLIDADSVKFEWVSTSKDRNSKITLDSVIFIAKQTKGNTQESGMEFMMRPYNYKAYCYEGYIRTREAVRLRDCTQERYLQIQHKINYLYSIQNPSAPPSAPPAVAPAAPPAVPVLDQLLPSQLT